MITLKDDKAYLIKMLINIKEYQEDHEETLILRPLHLATVANFLLLIVDLQAPKNK